MQEEQANYSLSINLNHLPLSVPISLNSNMHRTRCLLFVIVLSAVAIFPSYSQKIPSKKYPSLFWEITGNGLKKPSYLFGTMHVSSKMVFHLSDSFYQAIRNVDAVALELNPDIWQGQMVRLDRLQQNYRDFSQA